MAIALIDTNVLVYSVDRGETIKQTRAIELLDWLQPTNSAYLSTQCLAEFFVVTTRRIRNRQPLLTYDQAMRQLDHLGGAFIVYDVTLPVIREAVRGVLEHQLSFYDAQIWAAARMNQIPMILSEDFQDQQVLEGVKFVNPFTENFKASYLV